MQFKISDSNRMQSFQQTCKQKRVRKTTMPVGKITAKKMFIEHFDLILCADQNLNNHHVPHFHKLCFVFGRGNGL